MLVPCGGKVSGRSKDQDALRIRKIYRRLASRKGGRRRGDAEEGLGGGMEVFKEIAAVLAPDHPPQP